MWSRSLRAIGFLTRKFQSRSHRICRTGSGSDLADAAESNWRLISIVPKIAMSLTTLSGVLAKHPLFDVSKLVESSETARSLPLPVLSCRDRRAFGERMGLLVSV